MCAGWPDRDIRCSRYVLDAQEACRQYLMDASASGAAVRTPQDFGSTLERVAPMGALLLLRNKSVGMLLAVALIGVGCSAVGGTQVLVDGKDWQLVVVRGPELQFRDGTSTSGASDYTRPVTLNEAASFFARDGRTVVAGPVTDEAEEVIVTTKGTGKTPAELATSHGLKWFWVVLPGEQSVSDIVARDGSGSVVDEFTLPPMPGAPPPPGS